jgi:predicted AAA+ superfamily ATPase
MNIAVLRDINDRLSALPSSIHAYKATDKICKNRGITAEGIPKGLYIDSGLFIHLQRLSPDRIGETGIAGQITEIAVFSRLNSYIGEGGALHYFRAREAEVDFIAETVNSLIPIEVKFRTSPKNLKGVAYFMKRFKTGTALVITKDVLKYEDGILFLPLVMFL